MLDVELSQLHTITPHNQGNAPPVKSQCAGSPPGFITLLHNLVVFEIKRHPESTDHSVNASYLSKSNCGVVILHIVRPIDYGFEARPRREPLETLCGVCLLAPLFPMALFEHGISIHLLVPNHLSRRSE